MLKIRNKKDLEKLYLELSKCQTRYIGWAICYGLQCPRFHEMKLRDLCFPKYNKWGIDTEWTIEETFQQIAKTRRKLRKEGKI